MSFFVSSFQSPNEKSKAERARRRATRRTPPERRRNTKERWKRRDDE